MKFKKNFFTKLIFLLKNQAGFFKPSSENKYLLFLFHHLQRKYIYVECLTDVSRNQTSKEAQKFMKRIRHVSML